MVTYAQLVGKMVVNFLLVMIDLFDFFELRQFFEICAFDGALV